jgi:hypothetical protein
MTAMAELGDDLAALVQGVGTPLVAAVALSHRGPGRVATAFRLHFAGGATLKGVRLPDAGTARRVAALVDDLGALAPRLIASLGAAMLTEWVEGTSLRRGDWSDDTLRRCGAALGRVHARGVSDADPEEEAARCAERVHDGLAILAGAAILNAPERAALARLARRYAPRACATAVYLGDYCADNIVCRAGGEPCLVDIETIAVWPSDLDLGRTWYRWPMAPSQRAAFLDGYRGHRDPAPFLAHLPFWHMAALVQGAVYRHQHQHDDVAAPVAGLRALLADASG